MRSKFNGKPDCLLARVSTLIVFFLTIFSNCFAQQKLPTVIPASPQAMDIAKYINYPVNYSTGIPDISIPLYEIKVNGLTLPISLSYHASGLKANQLSGWVGYGWTLNAEPAISRSIKGISDDFSNGKFGYTVADFNKLRLLSSDSYHSKMEYRNDFCDGYVDGEPDEFYFKLANKSGKFYFTRPDFGNTYKIATFPYSPIKIEPTINQVFRDFKVTDVDGSVYYMGPPASPGGLYTESSNEVNCWKANKIVTINNEEISFSYAGDTFPQKTNRDKVTIEDSFEGQILQVPLHKGEGYGTGLYPPDYFKESPVIKNYFKDALFYNLVAGTSLSGDVATEMEPLGSSSSWADPSSTNDFNSIISQQMLLVSEIAFPNGKLVFEKSNGRLTLIKIYSNNQLIKKIVFNASGSSGGYMLDSLHISTPDDQIVEKYSFDYHEGDALSSPGADHWGFFNGYKSNTYVGARVPFQNVTTTRQYNFPSDTGHVNFFIGDGSMEPSIAVKSHVLSKVVYPTGGFTTYDYELNKYRHNGQVYNGGGLRVSRIAHYPSLVSTPIVRTYKYGENEDGAGVTRRPFNLSDYVYEQTYDYYHYEIFVCGMAGCSWMQTLDPWPIRSRKRTYVASPLIDPFYSDGAPVRYGKVTEYIGDAVTNIGKNEYTYNVDPNAYSRLNKMFEGTTIVLDPHDDWMWGELTAERNYKYEFGQFALLKEKLLSYTVRNNIDTINSLHIYKANAIYDNNNIISNVNQPWFSSSPLTYPNFLFATNSFTSGTKLLTGETTTMYEHTGAITETKIYRHNKENQIIYSALLNSNQDSIITINKYPQDYGSQYNFINKNGLWLDKLISQQQYKNSLHIQTVKTNYDVWNGSIIAPVSVEVKEKAEPFTTKIRYHGYTNNGNITSVSKEMGPKVCYIWGYHNQYPVAKIENADYTLVTSVLGGATAIDNFQNSNPNEIDVDSFLSPLRWHPGLENALVTSYTYMPLVGMTSATNNREQRETYEYDNYQRLKTVKDHTGNILKSYEYHFKP